MRTPHETVEHYLATRAPIAADEIDEQTRRLIEALPEPNRRIARERLALGDGPGMAWLRAVSARLEAS